MPAMIKVDDRTFCSAETPLCSPSFRSVIAVGSIVAFVICLAVPATVHAQLPATQLDGIYPLGAAAGSTLELSITGDDLDDVDRLQFSHKGITAKQKMAEPTKFYDGPQPVQNTFDVSIAANVPSGKYQVRCQGKYGLSNARLFVVGPSAEIAESEPNNDMESATAASVPTLLNGQALGTADVDCYEISAPAGEQIFIDGHAQQLDSLINLAMTAYDAKGNILREVRSGAGRDPSMGVTVPGDGKLWLKVHDSQFRQGAGYSYRIAATVRPHIDFVFPPAAVAGKTETFTVYGQHLPGGSPSKLLLDGVLLQQKTVSISAPADSVGKLQFGGRLEPHVAGRDGFEYRLSDGNTMSNRVLMTLASAPVVREQADNDHPDSAQKLTLPCEVAGQFYPQRDVDWFSFEAKKDDELAIELLSHRLGLKTDPALLVQQVINRDDGTEQTKDVIFLDDLTPPNTRNESGRHEFETSSSDPSYLFKAPADGVYRLLVRDGYSSLHNDPTLVYRLVIREPQHDFRIIAVPGESPSSLQLRREGREVIRIFAERHDGFNGEIRVKADGLPNGVTSNEIIIGPGNRMGTLVLTASDQAQPSTASVKVTASARIHDKDVIRNARFGAASVPYRMGQPNSRMANVPARITEDLQLCVTDYEPAPALLTIGEGKPIESCRGMTLKVKYKAEKRDGIGGNFVGFPMNFPPNATASQVNIGGNKEGEFDLRFNATSPPGEYSIYLAGYLQNMPYARNPESVEVAKKRQEHIKKVLDDANKAVQEAQRTVQSKSNAFNAASSKLDTATSRKTTADKALKNAESQMKAAQKTHDERKQQSEAKPDDANLKKQFADAKTALTNAEQILDRATEEADKLKKIVEDATVEQKAATEAKAAADKASTEARAFAQEAQREKSRVDQVVRTVEQAARQRNVNVKIPSNTLNIKLADYPIELVDPGEVKAKQGDKFRVPLKFKRLFDYKGNFSLQVQPPAGVSGINVSNISINGDKVEGVLAFTLSPSATVGQHTLNLRASLSGLTGSLVMDTPLTLTVDEAAKE